MKYLFLITCFLLVCSNTLLCQFTPSYLNFKDRKGKITLIFGVEYRVTPIYKDDGFMQLNFAGRYTNVDNLHRGEAFSYGLETFFSKKLSFNLRHSLRKSLVVLPFRTIESDFGIDTAEKELLMGLHGFFDYHIQVFNASELFLRLGFSTYNGGSNFIVKETEYDENGEIIYQVDSQGSFDNEGINFGVGLAKNRFKFFLGGYTSRGNVYYDKMFTIITPYVKLSYAILHL